MIEIRTTSPPIRCSTRYRNLPQLPATFQRISTNGIPQEETRHLHNSYKQFEMSKTTGVELSSNIYPHFLSIDEKEASCLPQFSNHSLEATCQSLEVILILEPVLSCTHCPTNQIRLVFRSTTNKCARIYTSNLIFKWYNDKVPSFASFE